MTLKVRQFDELEAVNNFLQGGVIGEKALNTQLFGLSGKSLKFLEPVVATVTFTTANGSDGDALTLNRILEQINAAVKSVKARAFKNKLVLVEDPPQKSVRIASVKEGSSANELLGLPLEGVDGSVYNTVGGDKPALVQIQTVHKNLYTVTTDE